MNRRHFLFSTLALTGAGALSLAGCGGGGGGVAIPQGNAAVRAIALSAHQSLAGGRSYPFAAIRLAAPAGSQFASKAVRRDVPSAIVYDAILGLYKKYVPTGNAVSVSYYTDTAATVPAGSATVTQNGVIAFSNTYASYPATVSFSADTFGGNLPFNGSGSITFLDATGANTLTGSFTSKTNNIALSGTLNLDGSGNVTGNMTMVQGGVTTRMTNVGGSLSGDLTGTLSSDPYGWTGTFKFNLQTGAFTLTLNTGSGASSAMLDSSGNLVIAFADGTTQTITNPLTASLSDSGGGSTPAPTPNPSNSAYTVVLLPRAGFPNYRLSGLSGKNQAGLGANSITGDASHALLWNNAAAIVDLHPLTGFDTSAAKGISGDIQVGYGKPTGRFYGHALLWSGTAASVIDLNPKDHFGSEISGISGNIQVGSGTTATSQYHALLWRGTAESAANIHPPGFDTSFATAVSGNNIVGQGRIKSAGSTRALLWQGSVPTAIDLSPNDTRSYVATAVSSNTQVGYSESGNANRACLWHGSSGSFVDLHPATYDGNSGFIAFDSYAYGVSGDTQVGNVGFGSDSHAMIWKGTAASALDLHFTTLSLSINGNLINPVSSTATAIDSNGNITGYVTDAKFATYPVLWLKK